MASSKIYFGKKGFKYFVGYNDYTFIYKKVKPLWILLPKMSTNKRDFDEIKCMPFLIKVDKLLEKHNKFEKKSAIVSNKDLIVNL